MTDANIYAAGPPSILYYILLRFSRTRPKIRCKSCICHIVTIAKRFHGARCSRITLTAQDGTGINQAMAPSTYGAPNNASQRFSFTLYFPTLVRFSGLAHHEPPCLTLPLHFCCSESTTLLPSICFRDPPGGNHPDLLTRSSSLLLSVRSPLDLATRTIMQ